LRDHLAVPGNGLGDAGAHRCHRRLQLGRLLGPLDDFLDLEFRV